MAAVRVLEAGPIRRKAIQDAGWSPESLSDAQAHGLHSGLELLIIEATDPAGERAVLEAVVRKIATHAHCALILADHTPKDDSPRRARYAPFDPGLVRRTASRRRPIAVGRLVTYAGILTITQETVDECIATTQANPANSLLVLTMKAGDGDYEQVLENAILGFDPSRGWFNSTSTIACVCDEHWGMLRFRYRYRDDRLTLIAAGPGLVLDTCREAAQGIAAVGPEEP